MFNFIHRLLHHKHYCVLFLFTDLDGNFDSQFTIELWAKSVTDAEYKAHTKFPSYSCTNKILTISSERID